LAFSDKFADVEVRTAETSYISGSDFNSSMTTVPFFFPLICSSTTTTSGSIFSTGSVILQLGLSDVQAAKIADAPLSFVKKIRTQIEKNNQSKN